MFKMAAIPRPLLHVRFNSTVQVPRTTLGRIRELFKSPTLKSVFLTFVFGTVVVETMKGRKELEQLELRYKAKFGILEEAIERLKQGDQIDISKELKLANTLTKGKYNVVTDIELDDELEEFLKVFEVKKEVTKEVKEVKLELSEVKKELKEVESELKSMETSQKIESSKFL